MANILLGPLVSKVSGKIGGVVFAHGKGGAYIRALGAIVNPNTQRQNTVRSQMALISRRWFEDLTPGQRDAWAVFAANVPRKNKVNSVIHLTGKMEHQGSNMVALNAGLPVIDDGPADFNLPGEDPTFAVTASEGSQELTVSFDDSLAWASVDDAAMIIRMGLPQQNTINFFDGPYRAAGALLGSTATPLTGPQTVAVPFPIVEGQKLFVEGRVKMPDGRYGDWFRDELLCAV